MKKLLLASTALVLSAGVAAAEVSVAGDGRMGVTYDSAAPAGNEWAFTQRIRARFNMSGTTDSGLTFGGSFRADDARGAATNAGGDKLDVGGSHNVFVAGAFGRLAMGDVAGGAQTAVGDLHGVGLTGLGSNNENTFFQRDGGGGAFAGTFVKTGGNGGPNALYTYTMSGFTFAFSMSQPQGPVDVYSFGVRYELDGLFVGAGYEVAERPGRNFNHTAIGAGYDLGVAEVRATYGRVNNAMATARRDQFGISAEATFDATTVAAYFRRDFANRRNYGIGVDYDLGGGAALEGGIVRQDVAGPGDRTRADFGVRMRF